MADPLHQFVVEKKVPIEIAGIDASFTNASMWMVITLALASLFLLIGLRRAERVPGRWQSMVELMYEAVDDTVVSSAGIEARKYLPFLFTLFLFILTANLAGMLPYSFTVTSHIIVTVAFSLLIFVSVMMIAIFKQGFGFLRQFAPSGVPWPMLLLLVPIEILSYFLRPITLSVRLFANMMAGHVLLKVIAGFVVSLGLFGVLPLLGIVALTGLEVLIAVLQAYVFTVLACVYLNDALHAHH